MARERERRTSAKDKDGKDEKEGAEEGKEEARGSSAAIMRFDG